MAGGADATTGLARFLRDVVARSMRQVDKVEEQTKKGLARWVEDDVTDGIATSPYLSGESNETFLVVRKPPAPPVRPDADEETAEGQAALEKWRRDKARHDRHRSLYTSLFDVERGVDETLELVVSLGLVRTTEGANRHLFAAEATVLHGQYDELSVVAVGEPQLEVDWLPPHLLVGVNATKINLSNEDGQYVPPGDIVKLLKRSVGKLHAEASFAETRRQADDQPVCLSPSPAVLWRRREQRHLRDLLDALAADLEGGAEPSGPFELLATGNRPPDLVVADNDEPALPLAANAEQRTLIGRARTSPHLVLQGPPGTGKTHTIANLVSVLLAEGRRVLVTADRDRALLEVQGKLPKDLQPLLLTLLEDRKHAKTLNVHQLIEKHGTFDEKRALASQAQLRETLAARRVDVDKSVESVLDMREYETKEIVLEGQPLTPAGHRVHLRQLADDLEIEERYLRGVAIDGSLAADVHRLRQDVTDADRQQLGHSNIDVLATYDDLVQSAAALREATRNLPSGIDVAPFRLLTEELRQAVRDAGKAWEHLPPVAATELPSLAAIERASRQLAEIGAEVSGPRPTGEPTALRAMLAAYLELPEAYQGPLLDVVINGQRTMQLEVFDIEPGDQVILGSEADAGEAVALLAAATKLSTGPMQDLVIATAERVLNGTAPANGTVKAAAFARELASNAPSLPVVLPSGPTADLLAQAQALRTHLAAGRKMSRMIGSPKAVRDAAQLIAEARVDGSEVDTVEEADQVIAALKQRDVMARVQQWTSGLSLQAPRAAEPCIVWLTDYATVADRASELASVVSRLTELFVPAMPTTNLCSDITHLLNAADANLTIDRAEALQSTVEAAAPFSKAELRQLAVQSGADAQMLITALDAWAAIDAIVEMLPRSMRSFGGSISALAARVKALHLASQIPADVLPAELSALSLTTIAGHAHLADVQQQAERHHRQLLDRTLETIDRAQPLTGAGQRLRNAVADEDLATYRSTLEAVRAEDERRELARHESAKLERLRLTHPELHAAVLGGDESSLEVLRRAEELQAARRYRTAVEGLRRYDADATYDGVQAALRQLTAAEQKLSAQLCWTAALQRLKAAPNLASSLSRLASAQSAVPKGKTAKSYPTKLRALKSAIADAQAAIPCWVMPLAKVAEVLGYPAAEDRFDTIIIDESSQALFPAAFLYAIADQIIVVGDHLQTSPSDSAVSDATYVELRKQHLEGHRLEADFGGSYSLYDIASALDAPRVMVDHFRCVPEIIELSNRLCYEAHQQRLVPTRVRFAGDLEPVIHHRVQGHRTGKTTANLPEVAAIVERVVACHTDPAYRNMTFGVVVVGSSTLSHTKALNEQLLEVLGPRTVAERDMVVGSPAMFQGAERNVMFLSLVAVPQDGGMVTVWPHEFQGRNRRRVQELNVAVSRAQDQLHIFHSFSTIHLKDTDARRILLEQRPPVTHLLEIELDKCDSNFERDVLRALHDADPTLRLRTQVEAAGRFIDIVVEDKRGARLAVECDGDHVHSSFEQLRDDAFRESVLRTFGGWRFVRILYSEWQESKDDFIRNTLEQLAQQIPTSRAGARPVAEPPADPSETETYDTGHVADWIDSDDAEPSSAEASEVALTSDEADEEPGFWHQEPRARATKPAPAVGLAATPRPSIETLECGTCGTSWDRPLVRGSKPKQCDDCRDTAAAAATAATSRPKMANAPDTLELHVGHMEVSVRVRVARGKLGPRFENVEGKCPWDAQTMAANDLLVNGHVLGRFAEARPTQRRGVARWSVSGSAILDDVLWKLTVEVIDHKSGRKVYVIGRPA